MKTCCLRLGNLFVMLATGIGFCLISCDGKSGTKDAGKQADAKHEAPKGTKHKRPPKKPEKPNVKVELPPLPVMGQRGKLPTLTDEQLDRFLTDSHRNALALLAAYRIKGDIALLREAAAAFPDHAGVQLEMALRGTTPEEKSQALDRFRKLEPDNSLGDYLSAFLHFQQGNAEEALKDMSMAASHAKFTTHRPDVIQCVEDAYLSAGHSLSEARGAAMFGQPATTAMPMSMLAGKLAELHGQHLQSGDTESAGAIYNMGMSLVANMRGESKLLIHDLVAMAMESRFLKQLPPESMVPGTNQTVAARLEAIDVERKQISALTGKSVQLQSTMGENNFLAYLKRVNEEGELNALRSLDETMTK